MDACINTHAQTYTHIQHHEKLKVGIRQKKGTPKMDDRNTQREERWEDKFSHTSNTTNLAIPCCRVSVLQNGERAAQSVILCHGHTVK